MDEIVKKAMSKWPNVPHCHGWLALDARGVFRMRDEAAQAQQQPGDRIQHAALLAFIHRNYAQDAQGSWYFQNGPQRVFVDLEATPFIARTDPASGLVLHDGQVLPQPEYVYLTEQGQLVLQAGDFVAMLDDRDMAQCLSHLQYEGHAIEDAQLMDWLQAPDGKLEFVYGGKSLAVQYLKREALASSLGFNPRPRP